MIVVDPTSGFKFELDPNAQADRDLIVLSDISQILADVGLESEGEKFPLALAQLAVLVMGKDRAVVAGERMVALSAEREKYLGGLS